jgi:hypothetical protein
LGEQQFLSLSSPAYHILRRCIRCAQADVDEALRLMRMSKVSLLDGAGGPGGPARDPVTAVYEALRDDAQRSGHATYAWADLNALLGHKFTVRAHACIPSPCQWAHRGRFWDNVCAQERN